MNWLEKLRERVTHYRELKEALALLQARLERQETENDALSARLRLAEEEKGAVSERLAVLEQDRSELFTRQDRSRTELAETAERLEVRPRLTAPAIAETTPGRNHPSIWNPNTASAARDAASRNKSRLQPPIFASASFCFRASSSACSLFSMAASSLKSGVVPPVPSGHRT